MRRAALALTLLLALPSAAQEEGVGPEEAEDKGEAAEPRLELGSEGLVYRPMDGVELRLGARLHYDYAAFDPDVTPFEDGGDVRRLRLYTTGSLGPEFRFRVDYEFGSVAPGWRGVYLRYLGLDPCRLTAGNQLAPLGMDELTSSDALAFCERALPSALSPGYYLGVLGEVRGSSATAALGAFGDPLDTDSGKRRSGQGIVGRATWSPIEQKRSVLHLGLSGELRDIDDGTHYRLSSRPEVGVTDFRLVDTGSILDVDSTTTLGMELGALRGPFTAQAEFLTTHLDRDSADAAFDGWYAQAGWVLTGESRVYTSQGVFDEVRPKGDLGALETGVRLSNLDLDDADIEGGEETNLTLGLTWTLNRNLRFMLNYIRADAHPNEDGDDELAHVYLGRMQLSF